MAGIEQAGLSFFPPIIKVHLTHSFFRQMEPTAQVLLLEAQILSLHARLEAKKKHVELAHQTLSFKLDRLNKSPKIIVNNSTRTSHGGGASLPLSNNKDWSNLDPVHPVAPPKNCVTTQRLQTIIDHLWPLVDIDNDGMLTSNEFVLFVRKVTGDKAAIDKSTASRFIHFIDTSKDGKIDKTEILSFILHGVGLSTAELVLYSERSIA